MGLISKNNHKEKGFTLVELMIALFLSSLVMAVIGVAFKSQQKTYIAQEEVAEVQQELRAGLEIMLRELRNAGHDMTEGKTQVANGNVGFFVASPFQIRFAMDLIGGVPTAVEPLGPPDGDATDANENVAFMLAPAADLNNDGISDAGAADPFFGRDTGGVAGPEQLISNVHAVGFAYAYDSNGDGILESKNVGGVPVVIWAVPDGGGGWVDLDSDDNDIIDAADNIPVFATPQKLADAAQLLQIRAVRIWILARASRTDPDYTDVNTYKVGANLIAAPNDNFRRRLLTANVRCRNIGIVVE